MAQIDQAFDDGPIPHADDCRCDQCRAIAALIESMDENGRYAFTDSELSQMFRKVELNQTCECPRCQALRGAGGAA